MSGLTSMTPTPTEIKVRQQSRLLEVHFADGAEFALPFEYLRVMTPSADARGHGPGQEVLQVGKRDVGIERIEPVGNYAICPFFTDGHHTGIYSWDMLYQLGQHQDELWQTYLERLEATGSSRDPSPSASGASDPAAETQGGCGKGSCGQGGCSNG
jgi:DUF971 family protein